MSSLFIDRIVLEQITFRLFRRLKRGFYNSAIVNNYSFKKMLPFIDGIMFF